MVLFADTTFIFLLCSSSFLRVLCHSRPGCFFSPPSCFCISSCLQKHRCLYEKGFPCCSSCLQTSPKHLWEWCPSPGHLGPLGHGTKAHPSAGSAEKWLCPRCQPALSPLCPSCGDLEQGFHVEIGDFRDHVSSLSAVTTSWQCPCLQLGAPLH